MGGGGGGFVPRTREQLEVVPSWVDGAVAVVSGLGAAVTVSPFLMCVDRAVVSAAAGSAPGGSLFRAIAGAASEFVTKPRVAFTSPALWMVAGVYGATYAAANLSDVVAERFSAEASVKAVGKFTATTGANMTGGIYKDAAFARLFGAAAAAGAAASAPPVVPLASYALFAVRDCLTIGGAFFVPGALSGAISASGSVQDETTADALSQLVSPPLMQVVCTPMHLLALNLVNAPGATAAARTATLRAATPAALLARSLRMLPAYGVGGLLNGALTKRGRDAALAHYRLSAAEEEERKAAAVEAAPAVVGYETSENAIAGSQGILGLSTWNSGERVVSEVESGTPLDALFGDEEYGEHYLHKFAKFLYGGEGSVHPVLLAPPADLAAWSFRWERVIQSTVAHQLAEMGGDTVGGCVVVGGDAELDAAVDAFVARVDVNGDGRVSVSELEAALARERAAGAGWAAAALQDKGREAQSALLAKEAAAAKAKRKTNASDGGGDGDEEDAEPSMSAEEIKRLLRRKLKGREME